MAQPRGIFRMIFKNFINSLKPRQIRGTLMGSDQYGNKYFEIPANPSIGKSRKSRWYEPPNGDEVNEIPAEWESWLRSRRVSPPTAEEIIKNLQLKALKEQNSREIDKHAGKMTPMQKGMETFPKRSEYETVPGRKT